MQNKTISEINEIYNLEIEKVVKTIKRGGSERVLLQFPDGMKPYAEVVVSEIEGKVDCECFIWLGSCFGACDLPLEVERLGIDLIIQFGHSEWDYKKYKNIKVI